MVWGATSQALHSHPPSPVPRPRPPLLSWLRRKVHERDRNSEFLLIVLRGLLAKRPDLRLVLMSATLQQGKYSGYFGGCPITTIGARTFPVQVRPGVEQIVALLLGAEFCVVGGVMGLVCFSSAD